MTKTTPPASNRSPAYLNRRDREASLPRWALPLLTAALFFFYAFLFDAGMDSTITAKVLALFVCAGIILLMFLKSTAEKLRERISIPFLAISGYVLVCGISTFYAVAGKFAIKEYIIMLCSFGLFRLVCAVARANETSTRAVASVIAGALGVYSLISIDSASLGWIAKAFKVIISPFTGIFENYGGFETGTRITSIFANPNTYAGVTALGILLTLYLVLTETVRKKRNYYLALLAVNSLGFLLAFSMGGTAMFALSIAVYLIAAGKGKRIPAFILMLETAVTTLLMAIVSYSGLGQQGLVSVIPLVALVVNALLLILLDRFVGEKLIGFLENKGKVSAIFIGVLAALLALYLVLGFLLTGSYTFSAGEGLRRSAYPSPGEYSLHLVTQSEAEFHVMIESQNDAQTQLHTSTTLYQGQASGAAFTVPEGAKVVYFNFTAPEGGTLEEAVVKGAAEEHKLSLKYRLFPEFVANRLQGLWANENAIQRLVFFKDGFRVFAKSPLIGSGLGSFENSLFGVQDFYYTTKYVHNHYIQSLADTGLLGFVFFTGSIVLLAVCLIRNRKTDRGCFPALAACLMMIAGHSMVEVSFSTEIFQPTAFLVFALIVLNFSTPIPKKPLGLGYRYGAAAYAGVFAVLLCGNLFAKVVTSESSFENLETAAKIDAYEKNDYKTSYVIYSPNYDDDHLRSQAAIYAQQLRRVKSNSISAQLVKYYINVGKYEDVFDCMEEGLAYTKSQAQSWQSQFINLEYAFSKNYNPTYDKLMKHKDDYVNRALGIVDMLIERNRTMMDQAVLLPRNNMIIGNLYAIQNLSEQSEIDAVLENRLFSLDGFADINQDGIPDALTVLSGSLTAENGVLRASAGTTVQLTTFYDLEGTYQVRLEGVPTAAVSEIQFLNQASAGAITSEGNAALCRMDLPENVDVQDLAVRVTFSADTELTGFTLQREIPPES